MWYGVIIQIVSGVRGFTDTDDCGVIAVKRVIRQRIEFAAFAFKGLFDSEVWVLRARPATGDLCAP